MATIIIKNSTGSGAVPPSLQQGELAINTKDGKLFYGSGSGNIVKEFTGSGGGSAISASYALTASYAANGGVTQLLAGANISLSPTTGVGQVTISSTGGGGGGFNTATGSYGSFYDTTTQTNPVANVPRSMSFNSTDITNGVSISGSTSPFNTYIKTENAGVYNIQFSAQLDKTDGGSDEIVIWLRKNGINLTDTSTTITLSGSTRKQVAAWNWFVNSAANDYYQIIWTSADTNVRLLAEPADGHPGIPSVILTVNRVDQFLSNTGSFSGSFNGSFTGSLFGTASWATNALTASRAISASYAPIFPYVGTATITGSLIVSSSTTQLSGPSHTVRASTGDISLFATASSINTQTQRFRIYDPSSTVGVSDHLYIYANTSDGGMYWSGNDEVIANYNQAIGRYNYGNNNLYVSSSDNRTYSPSGFVGPLIGTASWATNVLTASAATTVEVNDVPSNNATNYLSFFLANSGFRPSRVASTKFVVNPATGSMGINKSTITTGYNLDVNGSVLITGSLVVSGSITGSLFGTASWAINALTASFINTSSTNAFVQNGNSFGATALLGTNDNQSLAFETSGSTRMFISSSGNVGIGTSAPIYALDVTSPTGSTAARFFGASGTATVVIGANGFLTSQASQYRIYSAGAVPLTLGSYGTYGDLWIINGNVGVGQGTTAPTLTSRFTVKGSGATSATTALRIENTNASASLVVLDNGSVVFGSTGSGLFWDNTNLGLVIGGTTLDANYALQINSAKGIRISGSGTGQGYSLIRGTESSSFANNGSAGVFISSTTLVYNTGGTERMRVNSSGNVLIGTTTNSGFRLDVSGSTRITNNLTVTGSTILNNGQTTIKGAGATSATTTLIVQNSTPTNIITVLDNGTVGILRAPTASLDIAGTTRISGSFDTAISGSILTVIGSGSTQPIFTVQGSQGELFSINDSLSGSLFSVNDISGLPILEVFSDSTTLIGDYQDPMLITTKKVTMTNSGSFVVYSLPTASYDTAFFDYSIKSGSNARAGQIMAIQSDSSVNFTETTTTSFGSTTDVSFTVIVSGSNMVLTGSAATGSWTIKSIIRGI